MKMDKRLLEKYALGNCSDQERELVEQWLMNSEEEETVLSETSLDRMTSGIWTSLEHNFSDRTLSVKRSWWVSWPRYVAAACVLVGLITASVFTVRKGAEMDIAFSSNGLDHDLKATSQVIDFYLKPNSSVKGKVSRLDNDGCLDFSGAMKIVSNAKNDLEINFRAKNSGFVSRKKVTIQGQQTYYVGVLKQDNAPDEILVLTSQQLEDIPPRIKIVAFKDYSI